MTTGRYLHTATVLLDGRVLVVGGRASASSRPPPASAEVFDPRTGSWITTRTMTVPRSVHTATLLPDGRVLVSGGYSDWAALDSAELFDPMTGTWTVTGSMHKGRGYHTATLLPDGTVLVAGGRTNDSSTGFAIDSAELYNPGTGTWTPTGTMNRKRTFHSATLLPSGQVLVAGAGIKGVRVDLAMTAELYDPSTGKWSATGGMTTARAYHTATLLKTGRVLVVGGYDSEARRFQAGSGSALASADLYDPATGSWSAEARASLTF